MHGQFLVLLQRSYIPFRLAQNQEQRHPLLFLQKIPQQC